MFRAPTFKLKSYFTGAYLFSLDGCVAILILCLVDFLNVEGWTLFQSKERMRFGNENVVIRRGVIIVKVIVFILFDDFDAVEVYLPFNKILFLPTFILDVVIGSH